MTRRRHHPTPPQPATPATDSGLGWARDIEECTAPVSDEVEGYSMTGRTGGTR